MSRVLIIQNTSIEGLGNLENLLKSDGFDLHTVNAKREELPQEEFSLGIVLGGPDSVNDNLPYLENEQKLIRNFVEKDIPILGICLGSQLMAKTFGAAVYKGPQKEIGFYSDLEHENNSNLFLGIKNPFTVFHWHGETFDLPDKAVLLVHSKNYQNQAFQFGSAVGLQFHLEVDEKMINLWLDKTEEKLGDIPYIDPQQIRDQIEKKLPIIKNNLEIFYNNFKFTFKL